MLPNPIENSGATLLSRNAWLQITKRLLFTWSQLIICTQVRHCWFVTPQGEKLPLESWSYIMFDAETQTGNYHPPPRPLWAGKLPLPVLSPRWEPLTEVKFSEQSRQTRHKKWVVTTLKPATKTIPKHQWWRESRLTITQWLTGRFHEGWKGAWTPSESSQSPVQLKYSLIMWRSPTVFWLECVNRDQRTEKSYSDFDFSQWRH